MYLYQAVDGCEVLQIEPKSIQRAKRIVDLQRRDGRTTAEVERVLVNITGGRKYWRWRSGKWTPWDASDPSKADLQRWGATNQKDQGDDQ